MSGSGTSSPQHDLGHMLRRARQLHGWSLKDAATASGGRFKASTISSYERGDRAVTVHTLELLADLYRIPVASFLPQPGERDHDLTRRISQLPSPHRQILTTLVDRMLHDLHTSTTP